MSTPFGATAVGLRTGEGVVLAADKRMSYCGFILSRDARMVFTINERVGVVVTGFYEDMNGLQRILKAEVRYYESLQN